MIHVFIVHIGSDLDTAQFDRFISLVTKEKREKIGKFHFYADKQRTLLGEVLVHYAAKRCFDLDSSDLIFDKGEYGKPFLESHPEIEYNISHAGDYVVCAMAQQIPVGIDVEVIKPMDDGIAKRFFTTEENEFICSHPTNLQVKAFYSVWTKKESYIKMLGKGLSIPLKSFSVIKSEQCFQQFISNETVIGHICTEKFHEVKCETLSYSMLTKLLFNC